MDLRDLTSALPGRKRRRKGARADAPRTIVPEVTDLSETAARLAAPRGATAPAGPLDASRIDAARARLRREIAPVEDDDLD